MDAETLACRGRGTGKMRQRREAEKVMHNAHALLTELKCCSMQRDLQWGRRIHAKAVESGNKSNMYVLTGLVKMYAKCGSMAEARRVFDSIPQPDGVSWTALLMGYANNGEGHVALDLFSRMKSLGCAPDPVTYVAALKACTSLTLSGEASGKSKCLERVREIHSEIGPQLDQYLQNTLIDMYCKCGSMGDARRVFDSIAQPNSVSWTALLMGYADNGEGHVALGSFARMQACGCQSDSVTLVAALKACTSLALNGRKAECLERGRAIHSGIGWQLDRYVQNTLIDMYVKCGSLSDARRVFDSVQSPDVVSWSALIMGYAENGEGSEALELFTRMKTQGNCAPNSVTYIAALKACASLAANGGKRQCLERGRQIHLEIGCHLNHQVRNTLVDMYAKCGSMSDARRVFDSIPKPDVVSWNALIQGYAENGEGSAALDSFSRMKVRCVPDSITYVAAVKACAALAVNGGGSAGLDCLELGRQIHLESGCHLDQYVQNTLIDMYAKCGSMPEARRVFDSVQKPDVVSWNALLMGYAENGEGSAALALFSGMKASGCDPDSITFIAAAKACATLAANGSGSDRAEALERGRQIHKEMGSHLQDHRVQNTLVDMYAKCGSMSDAQQIFSSIQKPDAVCWNTLLLGYVENGDGATAVELFSRMKASGCVPDSVTYVAAVKACGLTGDLALGRKLQSEISVSDFTAQVVTCLVDFYAKCGSMVEARDVFDYHSSAIDVSTWNALMSGYSSFGDTVSVLSLFQAMQDKGFRPDSVTFVSLLSCCNHAGLVEKAREYFEAMRVKYGVTPTVVHYNCVIDVLGRANQLSEAVAVLRSMPCKPDAVTWRSLLVACHKWRNVEIGKTAFQSLVDLDNKDAFPYVLMSQIYGSRGMWEEQRRLLELKP